MSGKHDLTKGNLYPHFIRLAIPLIAGNILQQLYNTVDAFVIGRFASELEFASVGIAAAVMNLFLFAIVGSCVGLSVVFANLYGKKDLPGFRQEHFLVLVCGLGLTVLGGAAGILFLHQMLSLVQTPDILMSFTADYLLIVLAALPASFIYNLYGTMFRSTGRTVEPLVILGISVTVNLILDLVLVSHLGMGIRGAAAATAAVQVLSAAVSFIWFRLSMPSLMFTRKDCSWNRSLMKTTGHYCIVTGIQQTGLYIGKLLVQGAVNTGDIAMISAYTATTRIEGFINAFGDSGAAVTSVLTAQNLGAEKPERVKKTFFVSLIVLCIMGVVTSLIMYLTADITASLMLGRDTGAAFESASRYLQIIAIFYILNYTGNTFAGFFDGTGRVNATLIGTIGQITFRVILSWMLVAESGLPLLAVITGIGWILANTYWTVMYVRGQVPALQSLKKD